jgi:hypothetical protein
VNDFLPVEIPGDGTCTYNDYTAGVNKILLLQLQRPEKTRWRRGQTYMNLLWMARRDLYDQVTNTGLDPFYVEEHVPAFLDWLAANWGDQDE